MPTKHEEKKLEQKKREEKARKAKEDFHHATKNRYKKK
jgi:hypothetical protein